MRTATAADQRAIHDLVWSAGLYPLTLSWRRFIIAEVDGEIVGVGQTRVHPDHSRELASLAVQQAFQKRGIGSRIVKELLAADSGDVFLLCVSRLIKFYEGLGFRVVQANRAVPIVIRFKWRLGTLGLHVLGLFGGLRTQLAIMSWHPIERP